MISKATYAALASAACNHRQVSGWTHNFYRYPARFSPQFAAAAIAEFSRPGDLVGDPYMGGGTVVVEALAAGRHAIGNDLNSLATFIARVKTTQLNSAEVGGIRAWARDTVASLSYRTPHEAVAPFIDARKVKNLSLDRARYIKKVVASALASLSTLPSERARDLVRCSILRVTQWALDGKRQHTPLPVYRTKLASTTLEMLAAAMDFWAQVRRSGVRATLLNMDAALLDQAEPFSGGSQRLSLIVTSPPYPGVHVLYHRWQVNGRRESPAPYWISGCNDGKGASFYNFGDRRQGAADVYFENSLRTLTAIRRIVRDGGHLVQMLAFHRRDEQLPRYLENVRNAGFHEVKIRGMERIWREVPNRKWHATLRGRTSSAREVVLIHRAV